MRRRSVVIILLGALVAGSIAAPLANFDCDLCSGEGKQGCSACRGTGAVSHVFFVECFCGGHPACDLCYGRGYYPQMTTKPCEECDGKGWIPCPVCGGDGKRNLLDQISDLWRGKLEQQE